MRYSVQTSIKTLYKIAREWWAQNINDSFEGRQSLLPQNMPFEILAILICLLLGNTKKETLIFPQTPKIT